MKYSKETISLIFASLMIYQPSQLTYAKPLNITQETPVNNAQQSTIAITPLELNKSIERELKGGESHSYSIKLEANQYLKLGVEQKGINLAVGAFSPTDEKVYQIDAFNGVE